MYITSTPAEITTVFFLHTNVTIAISIKAPATKNNNSPLQLLSCAITPIKTQIVPMTANEIDTFFTMLPPLIYKHVLLNYKYPNTPPPYIYHSKRQNRKTFIPVKKCVNFKLLKQIKNLCQRLYLSMLFFRKMKNTALLFWKKQ